ncbi:MAG: chemotaxis protein CheD [Pirellulales bacterium]|nr:chemotaxis protein CheD [Pirellulales bacterium]
MSLTASTKEQLEVPVGMGQIVVVGAGQLASTVLGSCIGLSLYHPARRMTAVAHIVLPCSQNRTGLPGKFADTAVPHMLDLLAAKGAQRSGLNAKLSGGASMLGGTGMMEIGAANRAALIKILEDLRIPIVGEHLGGKKGRRITVNGRTGDIKIEIQGEPVVTL